MEEKDNINVNLPPEETALKEEMKELIVSEDTALTTQKESEELKTSVEEEVTYKEISPIRMVLRRFFRSKLSIVGIVMLVFLFAFSFLGPVIYNRWGEDEIDESTTLNTYIYTYTPKENSSIDTEVIEELQQESLTNTFAPPGADHLLGTDDKGMDVFVRLMYGGRISLTIGFIVVIFETIIGIVLGGIAGYYGGWVDQVIMRIVDIFNCIPPLPILLIASAVIDSWQLTADQRIYILMVMITLFSWSGIARLVRGQILSLREQEYITATEVMGFSTARKIFKHLIPNVMPQLIVAMTLGLGSVILYESTLSYLGLGVQLPKAAWGTMISTANDPQVLNYHLNMWLPAGIMIVIAVLGFNFVGDGLRDAMDPKSRK